MSETKIDYRIHEASTYTYKKGHASKQISRINQQSKQFQFQNAQSQFQFQVLFKSPALISKIEISIKQCQEFGIQMFYQGKPNFKHIELIPEDRISVFTKRDIKLEDKAQVCDKAVVIINNYVKSRASMIKYLLFTGFKEETARKQKIDIRNFSDKDTFEQAVASKKKAIQTKEENKKLFNEREKGKIKATPVKDLVQGLYNDEYRRTRANNEDSQLKRAIEQSRRQQQEIQKSKRKESSKIHETMNINEEEPHQFYDYEVVEWDTVKKIYEHVNQNWIQAQRKIQKQRSIQLRHSVAQKIKIKIFSKLLFCVNNIHGPEKVRLVDLVKELGGRIIEEPSNNCYVVTNKMEGGKINLAKSMDGIKFIKPEFIEHCWKSGAKLDEKDYRL